MDGLKHILLFKNGVKKHHVQKIRENNTLYNYLSDIKIHNRLLKIQFVERKAHPSEYSR